MNSKDIKTYNLPEDGKPLYRLEVKPHLFLLMLMVVGLILIFPMTTVGAVCVLVSSYCLIFLPSKVLLEFYEQYVIMFNKAAHDDCVMVYYEDIIRWRYIRGTKVDYLVIELADGTREKIECFNYRTVTRYMRMFAADREVRKGKQS